MHIIRFNPCQMQNILGETKDVLMNVMVFRMVFFNIVLGSQQKTPQKLKLLVLLLT